MLGREPRLPHTTMRWLIISLMVINGIQLVVLQLSINSSALPDVGLTLIYLVISTVGLLAALALVAYAYARGRAPKG